MRSFVHLFLGHSSLCLVCLEVLCAKEDSSSITRRTGNIQQWLAAVAPRYILSPSYIFLEQAWNPLKIASSGPLELHPTNFSLHRSHSSGLNSSPIQVLLCDGFAQNQCGVSCMWVCGNKFHCRAVHTYNESKWNIQQPWIKLSQRGVYLGTVVSVNVALRLTLSVPGGRACYHTLSMYSHHA